MYFDYTLVHTKSLTFTSFMASPQRAVHDPDGAAVKLGLRRQPQQAVLPVGVLIQVRVVIQQMPLSPPGHHSNLCCRKKELGANLSKHFLPS